MLRSNTVLYISFVEGDYKKSGFKTGSSGDRVYFYFNPSERIKEVLKENNFEIINTINIHCKRNSEVEEMHTIIIAKIK